MTSRLSRLFLLILITLFGISGAVLADVRVSGGVNGIWTADNERYLVQGHLSIAEGDSLIIEPGVEVQFLGNFNFDVRGTLWAVGEGEDSIRFISNRLRPGDWRSIKFYGRGAAGSRIERCAIRYTHRGIELDETQLGIYDSEISFCVDAAVRMVTSVGIVSGCNIHDSGSNGIAMTEESRVEIMNCEISNCGRYSIAGVSGSIVEVDHVNIDDSGSNAIYLSGAGACRVTWAVITDCEGRAISVEQSNNCYLARNVIYRSSGAGIYGYRSQNLTLLNNTMYETTGPGIQLYASGGGIYNNLVVYSESDGLYMQDSEPVVDFNDIFGNSGDDYRGIDPGNNDISANPQLVNPAVGDFSPREGSPVIDVGRYGENDLDGTRADIGAWFFNQNHPPEITNWSPQDPDSLEGDVEIEFVVEATDEDEHEMSYSWYVNGVMEHDESSFTTIFREDGDYIVRVVVDDRFFEGTTEHIWEFSVYGADVPEIGDELPSHFVLEPAYPNPFNSSTRLRLNVMKIGQVTVGVYDITGRHMMTVVDDVLQPGSIMIPINAERLPAGAYMIRAQSINQISEQKIVLIR